MEVKINIEDFSGVAVVPGENGQRYLIMVNKELPEIRKKIIDQRIALNKLEMRVYIPGKEVLKRLRSEFS